MFQESRSAESLWEQWTIQQPYHGSVPRYMYDPHLSVSIWQMVGGSVERNSSAYDDNLRKERRVTKESLGYERRLAGHIGG